MSRSPSRCSACCSRHGHGLPDLFQWRAVRAFPARAGDGCARRADLRQLALVRRNLWPIAAALLVGAAVAIVSALLVAKALGAPRAVLVSLAPKSITAGVAMAVSETLGGAPPLTAVLVIATGVLGAIIVTPLMNALGVRDFAARGFRRRARFARHRNGARLLGRSGRRRLRRPRHGAQRCRDPRDHSGAAAVASTIIEGALTPRARRP